MSVCVDPLFDWPGPRGHKRWCHMSSDDITEDGLVELHAMADRIGLKRSYFQSHDESHPHYDLVPSKRALAVRHGAIELASTKEYSKRCSLPRVLSIGGRRLEEMKVRLAAAKNEAEWAELERKIAASEAALARILARKD